MDLSQGKLDAVNRVDTDDADRPDSPEEGSPPSSGDEETRECPYCGEEYGPKGIGPHKANCSEKPDSGDSEGSESFECNSCGQEFQKEWKSYPSQHDCPGDDEDEDTNEAEQSEPESDPETESEPVEQSESSGEDVEDQENEARTENLNPSERDIEKEIEDQKNNGEGGGFVCPVCDEKFLLQDNYKTHRSSVSCD